MAVCNTSDQFADCDIIRNGDTVIIQLVRLSVGCFAGAAVVVGVNKRSRARAVSKWGGNRVSWMLDTSRSSSTQRIPGEGSVGLL